jgi:hypothetical protein
MTAGGFHSSNTPPTSKTTFRMFMFPVPMFVLWRDYAFRGILSSRQELSGHFFAKVIGALLLLIGLL